MSLYSADILLALLHRLPRSTKQSPRQTVLLLSFIVSSSSSIEKKAGVRLGGHLEPADDTQWKGYGPDEIKVII